MDVNPLVGRHRVAAVATLTDVVLAHIQVATVRGEYNVIRQPVAVVICPDCQMCYPDHYLFVMWFMECSHHV